LASLIVVSIVGFQHPKKILKARRSSRLGAKARQAGGQNFVMSSSSTAATEKKPALISDIPYETFELVSLVFVVFLSFRLLSLNSPLRVLQ
jgi:hypothetical protein